MSAGHDHHPEPPSEVEARVLALESLLIERGLLTQEAVDGVIAKYERDVGPLNGARVVARAWTDSEYRRRLLVSGGEAVADLGIEGRGLDHLQVVENTPQVHNVIVCTLCSCYPWAVLGLPPVWYKAAPYRSRVVMEPREVLREMGLELPEAVEIRVWDSSADLRYMVLPEQPAGTEGWSEEELARLVTRDSMIGVGRPKVPAWSSGR